MSIAGKVLVETRIKILFWLIESIEIKVIEVYSRNRMNFNQRVGGAFHRAGVARRAQQAAHQSGLAGAQVAVQPCNVTGLQDAGKPGAEAQGGGLVGKRQRKIVGMHGAGTDSELKERIRRWGRELGFDAVGFAPAQPLAAEDGLLSWLAAGCHGEMDYMAAHGTRRSRPAELVPGTRSVVMVRINYRPPVAGARSAAVDAADRRLAPDAGRAVPERDDAAAVSCYARGRDYHKLVRRRLQQLGERIVAAAGGSFRAFTDSAPVMEVELARLAGLGWRGKHTLLLDREAGSWFFLGALYLSHALPPDAPATDHCGTCTACLDACPTQAFDAPYRLDARRCVSYLTIEAKGAIPEPLRAALGDRIYGCDDCQTACPWNREAPATREDDFLPREGLEAARLTALFAWDAAEFERRLQGSAIRRIGHERWLRNIAVALGNAPPRPSVVAALRTRENDASALVREHVAWALRRHGQAAVQGEGPVATGRDGSLHHSLQEPG